MPEPTNTDSNEHPEAAATGVASSRPGRVGQPVRRVWRSVGRAWQPVRRAWRPVARGWRRVPWHRLGGRWLPSRRRTLTGLLILLVTLVGAVFGLLVGSRTAVEIGPFNAELRINPAASGDTAVFIPPLGALHLNTHDGPTRLTIQLGTLDQARTQEMLTDPGGVTRAAESVADDVVNGVIRVGLGSLGAAVLGAMLLASLVFRNMRKVAWSGGLAFAVMAGSFGTAALTFRVNAVEEPRYEGLLVNAPALVGDVQRIADDYERYTEQLQRMVSNVSTLYTAASGLDSLPADQNLTRVLHVADLHNNPGAWQIMRTVVEQYGVDFIVDSGDISDWGSGAEAELYVDSIRLMRVPYVYVRGNHDSKSVTEAAVAEQPNAIVLDDQVETLSGLTVAGVGDPQFTPDQRTTPHTDDAAEVRRREVLNTGAALAATIGRQDQPVDIAAVHDPIAAEPLAGVVPLVLAGHRHDRFVGPVLMPAQEGETEEEEEVELEPGQTRLMVQASTGGAGLRGLEGEHPESLGLSVLYFNESRDLIAYDDIVVGGHGLSEVTVQRNLIPLPPEEFESPDVLDGGPPP